MSRNAVYTALVLRVKPSGEANRDAWFLTAEEGVIKATVFGGPKSKLRACAAPFNQGTLWIYHNPLRDSRKVSDFDVQSWRPGLRELYERTMAADAMAETVLASHGGGGNWGQALNMAGKTLDALEKGDEKSCPRTLIHFLWNWADMLGIRPDLGVCASCACEAPRDGVLWYNGQDGNLYCPSCAKGAGFAVGPGARLWLSRVQDLDPAGLDRISLDKASIAQAKALATAVLTEALGKRLPTWDNVFDS
ncbi:MAG: DNA repair protein RecO C-terminal domain-containing protein [Treponema sp.]|jgi:DNA repair protein RecO (recombination protein O)|nr:DNA repair protein RecO C-terminal domain-containing protein [Treponema sp.]